jgi:apolipoprotein N-acyltransferase
LEQQYEPSIFTQNSYLRNYQKYLLAILGGLLFWVAWPTKSTTFVIFFALLPLLWINEHTTSNKRFLAPAYVHMFVWNILTTWWIYNASAAGAVLAIILNSLLMCLPWLAMRSIKKRFGPLAGYVSLISFWISFEYIHLTWELSWPWLTLGNVFAMKTEWVQWFEYTGTTGGTLWVLISNIVLFSILKEFQVSKRPIKYYGSLLLLIAVWIIPLIVSNSILSNTVDEIGATEKNTHRNVVVVQPNVDPYEEKFKEGSVDAQIRNLINLSEQQIDSTTSLIIWPETAIPVGALEEEIKQNLYYAPVWAFLSRHPQLSLLSGIESYRNYGSNIKEATPTARYDEGQKIYYDAFNTAAMFWPDGSTQFYHKSKLVPGVETLPSFLIFIGKLFEDFGGTSGTLGRDKERSVFADGQHYFVAAPIICYESIYSDYVTQYVRKGANLLTIITNDGWWDNTPGYKQHMNYARLRAIETRRWIARSANTGISCFIDPVGKDYQPQPWDTAAVIKMNVEPLQVQTFFVQHGDYLSVLFNVISIGFLLLLIVITFRNRFVKKAHGESNNI